MVRVFLYCISLLLLAMLTQWYFSLRRNYRDGAKGLAVKAAGTFVPVFLCFYAVAEQSAWGRKWMLLAGVAVCMAADVVIGVDFVAGMLTFLAAHVCFILYYLTLAPFHPASLIIFCRFIPCAGNPVLEIHFKARKENSRICRLPGCAFADVFHGGFYADSAAGGGVPLPGTRGGAVPDIRFHPCRRPASLQFLLERPSGDVPLLSRGVPAGGQRFLRLT